MRHRYAPDARLEYISHRHESENRYPAPTLLRPLTQENPSVTGLRETDMLYSPTRAHIRLDRLRHNTAILRKYAGKAPLMAIVKSDAYGHGILRTARTLAQHGVRWFGVATTGEGLRLREGGIEERILVLTAPPVEHLHVLPEHELDITVSSPAIADAILECTAHAFRVHVKVDTGMGRIGISPGQAERIVTRLDRAPNVEIAGLWTHLATAYSDAGFAYEQLERFDHVVAEVGDAAETIHATATGSILRFPEATAWDRSIARAGIGLYGYNGLEKDYGLEPAMTLYSKVTHLKKVSPGTSISYGCTWTADRPTSIATVGAGYADGYPRIPGNRAFVTIRGGKYPVVGTVCMNMFMVDTGPEHNIAVGDDVMLFGREGKYRKNGPDAADLAAWAETISHEILVGVPAHVPRIYVQ